MIKYKMVVFRYKFITIILKKVEKNEQNGRNLATLGLDSKKNTKQLHGNS